MEAAAPEPPGGGPLVVVRGEALPGGDRVELEDGTEAAAPPTSGTLPLGYHRLVPRRGPARRLIVVPPRCHLPTGRSWGWAAQLYALRSAASWGMGDLRDLRSLCRWAAGQGAGLVLVNPMHAVRPTLPQQPSPYYPSSRRFSNPLYLRVGDVPGARNVPGFTELETRGRSLNRSRLIDRDRIFRLKMAALERAWRRFSGDAGFDRFQAQGGDALRRFACFCALSEERPGPWMAWPSAERDHQEAAIRQVAERCADRVGLHMWLQWLLHLQLERACAELRVVSDLALGVDPDGADAWQWQECLAQGARVGAPPDEFVTDGQDWGLPPFVPHKLRALDYQPFIDTLRGSMRPGGGLRIDHVMGLFRLWWIPPGMGARDGVYVRYPARDLLGILALESVRARCLVVGEDLGTVESGVREELARRRVLSYRVAWFEDEPPRRYPALAMAAMNTHDLATAAGVWTGSDLREQRRWKRPVSAEAEAGLAARLDRLSGVPRSASAAAAVAAAYRSLSEAPSRLLTATLDDAALSERRPNLPGAAQRPNWSIPLPRTLEQLRRDALPRAIGRSLSRQR
ncbi:MAG: 4-alpha-glucanotransferase [Candidatus Dormibacteraeota bacterium]|nr:4-alpha-glucanotransferase [Candidatus Dormibacteraeota bacterium]